MNVAIITARGGSKGLKRKNVLEFNGKPLIAWTIEAALSSQKIDLCYVTTEDEEIAEVSKKFGARVISRPEELAGDLTSSEDVLIHALTEIKKEEAKVSTAVLLQPTSPLRDAKDIDSAMSKYYESKAGCVISVYEPSHSAAKAYKLNLDGSIVGLMDESAPYRPRQELPRTFQPNGAIYIFGVDAFLASGKIPRENVYPFEMSESKSTDIDDINDFKKAEEQMRVLDEA